MTVTFFGHRDAPSSIQPILEKVLRRLIEYFHADFFYVGDTGNFDRCVARTLKKLAMEYPHITYRIVLAYWPRETDVLARETDFDNTILPEAVAVSLPKYAIIKRNNWMLQRSDVVAYAVYAGSNAVRYQEKARKQGKTVINLGEEE